MRYYIFFCWDPTGFILIYPSSVKIEERIRRELGESANFKCLEFERKGSEAQSITILLELDNREKDSTGLGFKLKKAFRLACVSGFLAQREQKSETDLTDAKVNQFLVSTLGDENEDEDDRPNPFLDGKPNKTLLRIIRESWLLGFRWAQQEGTLDAHELTL